MAGVGLVAAGVALTSGGGRSLVDTVCSGVKKCATALACAAKKLATTAADIVSPKPAAVPATRSVAIAQEKVQEKKQEESGVLSRRPQFILPRWIDSERLFYQTEWNNYQMVCPRKPENSCF